MATKHYYWCDDPECIKFLSSAAPSQRAIVTDQVRPPTIVRCRVEYDGKYCGAPMKFRASDSTVREASFPTENEPQQENSHSQAGEEWPIAGAKRSHREKQE